MSVLTVKNMLRMRGEIHVPFITPPEIPVIGSQGASRSGTGSSRTSWRTSPGSTSATTPRSLSILRDNALVGCYFASWSLSGLRIIENAQRSDVIAMRRVLSQKRDGDGGEGPYTAS